MRIGFVSDSHGRTQLLRRYLNLCREQRYDAVFHLGDYDSDAQWLEGRLEDIPLYSVAGNCDTLSNRSLMELRELEGFRVLAVHGHRQGVKYGLDRLGWFALEQEADIALFGHTHVPYVGWADRTLLVNPGALMDGRYGELTLEDGQVIPRLDSFAVR